MKLLRCRRKDRARNRRVARIVPVTLAEVALQAAIITCVIDHGWMAVSELPVVLYEGRVSDIDEVDTGRALEWLVVAGVLAIEDEMVRPVEPPVGLGRHV
jgi:hypothetical protein